MMKGLKAVLVGAAAAAALTAFGSASAQDDPFRIGFIYVGPISDHGWSYQHDRGRQAVEAEFDGRVETQYVENVAEGPDAARVMRQMASSGVDMIFATSFGFMDSVMDTAEQFPDVLFEHATGYQRADNVATYSARFYEGRTILGYIAGEMTETNQIGYIASFPIPEVVRGINAFTIELLRVNPNAEVNVVWVNTWYNPSLEAEAATALIDQGADIIVQHTDSPAALQVAEERGVYGFGQSSNMFAFAPDAQLTAIVDDWAPYYITRVQAALDGTWESTDTWDDIDAGMVSMSEYTNMPDNIAAEARALEFEIATGERHSFAGPINAQSGEEILAEGQVLDDQALLTMDYFVEGVSGSMPN